jgi:hypothetical protein
LDKNILEDAFLKVKAIVADSKALDKPKSTFDPRKGEPAPFMDAFGYFKQECGEKIIQKGSKYEASMFSIYSYLHEADKAFFEHLEILDLARFDEE